MRHRVDPDAFEVVPWRDRRSVGQPDLVSDRPATGTGAGGATMTPFEPPAPCGSPSPHLADQALVAAKAAAGELAPRRALAAVGGIEAAVDALDALQQGRFPGKIVIVPQLDGLPLTGLDELARDPAFAALLDADGSWTTAAEALLFERHWHPGRTGILGAAG